MIDQALGLLRLQLLLSWRSWTRGRAVAMAAGAALLLLGGVGVAAGSIALYFFAANGMQGESAYKWLLVFDALILFYTFFWVWSFLLELQRHDVFDLRKVLHLPVSPMLVFGLNFATSLLTPSIFIGVPVATALVVGAAAAHGPHLLLGFAHVAAFFLMLAAWQYHLRGWFSIWMENKRRRRMLMMVAAMVFILLAQAPWYLSYTTDDEAQDWIETIVEDESLEPLARQYNATLPPGWLALGGVALIERDARTAGWTLAALSGLALAGLTWGYRSTVAHYLGRGRGGGKRRAVKRPKRGPWTAAGGWPLADDTAALTMAQFLTYARHPQVRIQLFMPPVLGVLLILLSRREDPGALGEIGMLGLLPTVVLFMPFLNFSMMLFNLFGVDATGFRGLVLLPMPRYRTLLAKNLALAPFVCGVGFAMLALAVVFLEVELARAALFALLIPQIYLGYVTIGNLVSVAAPYSISRDTMRPRGDRFVLFFIGIGSMLLAIVMCLPAGMVLFLHTFGLPGWPSYAPPASYTLAAALLVTTLGIYSLGLRYTGDWLTTREQVVLSKLIRDKD